MSNGAKHQQPYFSLNKDKRTHLIYLGEGGLELARTLLNMALLKNNALT